jgi:hypothetical protein
MVHTAIVTTCLLAASRATAQAPPVHHLYRADAPPGALGRTQLQRGGPRAGYFQPVEVLAPEGAGIALVEDGVFGEEYKSLALVGLQIGHVYRLRVTDIPLRPGVEVFPTIELLDRLYPPRGEELRFPIPIDLTREELDLAAKGGYVTRVIYLENPQDALPVRDIPREQRYFEIPSSQDPLHHADELGRPMAILRIGSRVPSDEEVAAGLLSGPFLKYQFPPLPQQPIATLKNPALVQVTDKHPRVPRAEPDLRWMLAPAGYVPQSLPPRKVR